MHKALKTIAASLVTAMLLMAPAANAAIYEFTL